MDRESAIEYSSFNIEGTHVVNPSLIKLTPIAQKQRTYIDV